MLRITTSLWTLVACLAAAAACSGRDDGAPSLDQVLQDDAAAATPDAAPLDRDADAAARSNAEASLDATTHEAGAADAAANDASFATDVGIDAFRQCPGTMPATFPVSARRCRSGADCSRVESCGPKYQAAGCGACRRAERACEDGGCGTGLVCIERILPCTCSGASTACEPRCTDASCSADQSCGTNGRCEPRSCKQGYACLSNQVCAPDRMFADEHGCAAAHCAGDNVACPDGFRCEPALSTPVSDGCIALRCNNGFSCPPNRICQPDSSYLHGCAPKACANDADCDCGVCVAGTCENELFVCSPPPAP